jgi:hypothetical protein
LQGPVLHIIHSSLPIISVIVLHLIAHLGHTAPLFLCSSLVFCWSGHFLTNVGITMKAYPNALSEYDDERYLILYQLRLTVSFRLMILCSSRH